MKKIKLFLLLALCVSSLCACGKKNIENPEDSFIEKEVLNSIRYEEGVSFDKAMNFECVEVETSEDDIKLLSEKFASRIPYVKYECNLTLVTLSVDKNISYSAIFVDNGDGWKLSIGYLNEDKTKYLAKEPPAVMEILQDLKKYKVGTFEEGYVGDISNTRINIIKRNTDIEKGKDLVDAEILISTNFCEYQIPVKIEYAFLNGIWEIKELSMADENEWSISYNGGKKPNFISEDNILLKLTSQDNNFLYYVCNLDYVKEYSLVKQGEFANKDSVTEDYIFTVKYENFGTINYNVSIKYNWLGKSWSMETEMIVNILNCDLTDMKNKNWESSSGSNLSFSTCISQDNDENGFAHNILEGELDGKEISLDYEVSMRDNFLTGLLTFSDEEDECLAQFDFLDSCLEINGEKYF